METGFQAWKFAKGLYLIPLFMVYNPEIIMGGPWPLLIWTALTGFLALGAFAAALEGYLFTRMGWPLRVLLLPAIVAVFYPSLAVEAAGAAVMLVVLLGNWLASRRAALA